MHTFTSWIRAAALLLLLAAGLAPHTARASHGLGSDLYYTNVGPNIYLVTYRFYRDCSGIPEVRTQSLDYSALGCAPNNGTNTGGTATLALRGITDGNPYCRQILATQTPCDTTNGVSTNLPNFQIWQYSGVVTLPAQCSEWTMSITIGVRPDIANIDGTPNLFSEVRLNNRDVTDDSSPIFSIVGRLMPLAFMCDSSTIRYNCGVVDADGDSLVYSLAPALEGLNLPVTYTLGYSSIAPIRTLPGTSLRLDQRGTLTLTAGADISNALQNNKQNKFAVVVQVDAYRRVNGQAVRTGRVRRDIAVMIIPCNGQPTGPTVINNGIVVSRPGQPDEYPALGAIITAQPGEPLAIQVISLDVNGDSIYTDYEPTSLPSGATLSAPPASSAAMLQFGWTPTALQVRSQPYVVHFALRDNGCPAGMRACFTLPIQVVPQRPANGLAEEVRLQPLPAAPNPFTTEARLTLRISQPNTPTEVVIYDITGRLIERLPVAAGPAGERQLTWRPGADLKAGLYLARYTDAAGVQTARLQRL